MTLELTHVNNLRESGPRIVVVPEHTKQAPGEQIQKPKPERNLETT